MFSRLNSGLSRVASKIPSFTASSSFRSFSSSASVFRSSSVLTNNKNKFEFKWVERSVGVQPKKIVAYKAAQSNIDSLKAAATTDLKVPTIDWAYWSKEISDPTAVAKIRAEYEALNFEGATVSEADIAKKNAEFDVEILTATKQLAVTEKRIQEKNEEIKKWQYMYDNYDDLSVDDMVYAYPGIEEQHRAEFWDGHYVPDYEEQRNASYDPRVVVDWVEKGGNIFELPHSMEVPSVAAKQGSFDFHEEIKKLVADDYAVHSHIPNYVSPLESTPLPKFRTPKDHHDLLPLLADRAAGAPVFGAPRPGMPEEHH